MLDRLRYWFVLTLAPVLLAGRSPLRADSSFYKDVLPILQQRCQSCHRQGEIGQMPLTTYAEVRPWAKAIRESVMLRKMPPWFADPRFGQFANDPSLTPAEISTIQAWVDTGSQPGSQTDAPPPLEWTEGRALSKPTVITAMSQPFHIPAHATVSYQAFALPATFAADTWVTAVEIRPSDRSVVHHAVLYVREPGATWLDEMPNAADILAVYTPGAPIMMAPEGMAKKIPAGSDLVIQMHYTAKSMDANDRTEVAMLTSAKRPRYRLLTLQMNKRSLRIPPGDHDHRETISGTLPQEALLVSLFPHMHLRGKGFEYEIVADQGRVEILLKVNDYDFNWQLSYRLKTARLLPAGTRLRFAGSYDNSAANPQNPDPDAEVTWGGQSWEEMMVGFFDVAVSPDIDKKEFFAPQ
jgi:hypothetical protein